MWNTATVWPRCRGHCYGPGWLKMSAFPSTCLVSLYWDQDILASQTTGGFFWAAFFFIEFNTIPASKQLHLFLFFSVNTSNMAAFVCTRKHRATLCMQNLCHRCLFGGHCSYMPAYVFSNISCANSWQIMLFLAATKQLYEWFSPSSVHPSVRPSHLFHYGPIIRKFWGVVITIDRSDVHAKGQDQRSKVKVTEVKTQLSRFRTVTPVWIYIWQWNDAHSLMWHRRGALLFFKVFRQISRSHRTKKSLILTWISHFRTVTPFWIDWLLWNDAQSLK